MEDSMNSIVKQGNAFKITLGFTMSARQLAYICGVKVEELDEDFLEKVANNFDTYKCIPGTLDDIFEFQNKLYDEDKDKLRSIGWNI